MVKKIPSGSKSAESKPAVKKPSVKRPVVPATKTKRPSSLVPTKRKPTQQVKPTIKPLRVPADHGPVLSSRNPVSEARAIFHMVLGFDFARLDTVSSSGLRATIRSLLAGAQGETTECVKNAILDCVFSEI